MIKLITVKRAAERGKETLFRVRRRVIDGGRNVDSDGEANEPDSWRRWEAEYFQRRKEAVEATHDRRGPNGMRPPGIVDRYVTAQELWERYKTQSLLEDGYLTRLEAIVEWNPLFAPPPPVSEPGTETPQETPPKPEEV